MGELKHLVLVQFKEGVVVEEILKGMEKMASEIDLVKCFEWYFLLFIPRFLHHLSRIFTASCLCNTVSAKKRSSMHITFYLSKVLYGTFCAKVVSLELWK